MPKTTLVCGFYNRPNLVRRTLCGLAAQTDRDVQFYLFDDGSNDDTADVIESELDRIGDKRFNFVRHPTNIGLTAGLRRAVAATDSRYVAIHDAGDYSFPSRLGLQSKVLDGAVGIVVVGSHYVNYIEDVGVARLRAPCADNATLETTLNDPTFTHGEVMFRREAYDKVGGYQLEFRFSQDNDLWLRMINQGRFYTVKEVLYVRAIQLGGISYNPKSLARQSAFYVLGKRIAEGKVSRDQAVAVLAGGGDVFDILKKEDPGVQRVIQRAAFRSLAFGTPGAGRQIAQAHLVPGPLRTGLMALGVLDGAFYRTVARSGWRLLGSDTAERHVRAMLTAEREGL